MVVMAKKDAKSVSKGPWKAIGIVSDEVGRTAAHIEKALNELEREGYQARDPIQYGAHFIVYGRWPDVVVKD